jgi:tRNA(Ile)-lysidine synthase TilS/MesJ
VAPIGKPAETRGDLMNRHYYTLIARVIATGRAREDSTETLIVRLADALSSTQPNFDRNRFLNGCFENLNPATAEE